MDNNTIELLRECSSGCKMAIESIDQVYEYATENSMKKILDQYKEKHKKISEKVGVKLAKADMNKALPSKMAEFWSTLTTQIKMMINPDNHQIAKLMMDGCNMGIQSVSEYINKYPDADAGSVSLAKELIQTEERFMQEMKAFV